MEHMFDAIDIKEVMRQSLQVATWMQAKAATIEAHAWGELWRTSPWWFQLLMIVNVTAGVFVGARRFARRLGLRIP